MAIVVVNYKTVEVNVWLLSALVVMLRRKAVGPLKSLEISGRRRRKEEVI